LRIYINGSGGHVECQIGTKITNSDEIHQKETSLPSLFPFDQEVSERKMLTDNDDENNENTYRKPFFWGNLSELSERKGSILMESNVPYKNIFYVLNHIIYGIKA
jgi:hypothetical protein